MENLSFTEKVIYKSKVLRRKYFPLQSFGKNHLIVHFSYHKCLTNYYNRIFRELSLIHGFRNHHFNSRIKEFHSVVTRPNQTGVYSVNNHSDFDFETLPNYRGSHFIRDPRDLIVSGYRYHLWTTEKWVNNYNYPWERIFKNPLFTTHVESEESHFPNSISVRDYLNSINQEKGLIVEMLIRQNHFRQLEEWNYKNPLVMELKYEEIIGNEIECFKKLFHHYELDPKISKIGLNLVEKYSLKNRKKSSTSHVRHGGANQWKTEFSELHENVFNQLYPTLLTKLKY